MKTKNLGLRVTILTNAGPGQVPASPQPIPKRIPPIIIFLSTSKFLGRLKLEAKIGEEVFKMGVGDSIHCPRGTSHFIKNIGQTDAKLISYIFPGDWAEDFFAESSKQNHSGKRDLKLIEEKFGVFYL